MNFIIKFSYVQFCYQCVIIEIGESDNDEYDNLLNIEYIGDFIMNIDSLTYTYVSYRCVIIEIVIIF